MLVVVDPHGVVADGPNLLLSICIGIENIPFRKFPRALSGISSAAVGPVIDLVDDALLFLVRNLLPISLPEKIIQLRMKTQRPHPEIAE